MSDRRLIDGAAYTVDEFSAELLRLRADLAACQKRAAKAEQERDEARDECGGQAQMAADAIKRANDECAAARAQRDSLREALEWADAMIWPRIAMLERHNGGKPTEETSELRRILGPIRRAHKNGERVAALSAEMDRLRGLLREIASRLESGDINYAQGLLLAKRVREACE